MSRRASAAELHMCTQPPAPCTQHGDRVRGRRSDHQDLFGALPQHQSQKGRRCRTIIELKKTCAGAVLLEFFIPCEGSAVKDKNCWELRNFFNFPKPLFPSNQSLNVNISKTLKRHHLYSRINKNIRKFKVRKPSAKFLTLKFLYMPVFRHACKMYASKPRWSRNSNDIDNSRKFALVTKLGTTQSREISRFVQNVVPFFSKYYLFRLSDFNF
jgi:hypothetical protein